MLIREFVRRAGRGWPSIFACWPSHTQSSRETFTSQEPLFNPNYLHLNLHLLRPAYIPALGIGAWWKFSCLLCTQSEYFNLDCLDRVSGAGPINDALARKDRPEGNGCLFCSGCLCINGRRNQARSLCGDHSAVRGFRYACVSPRGGRGISPSTRSEALKAGWVPSPWLVGAGALIAGSLFLVTPPLWGWRAVAVYVILDLTVIAAAVGFPNVLAGTRSID